MRKKIGKVNSILLGVLVFLLIGLVGTTFAFYMSSADVDNMLITKGSGVFLAEYFSPDDHWLPGETKVKEVHFGNQSELDQVIRFKVVTEWFDLNGSPWQWQKEYDPAPAVINWTDEITGDSPTWTKIGDYYYYNYLLEAQDGNYPTETKVVIKSVTFSPDLSNDSAHAEDFSDKVCRITIQMESLDVNTDIVREAWRAVFSQNDTSLTWKEA